jgi:hypothetical protein
MIIVKGKWKTEKKAERNRKRDEKENEIRETLKSI